MFSARKVLLLGCKSCLCLTHTHDPYTLLMMNTVLMEQSSTLWLSKNGFVCVCLSHTCALLSPYEPHSPRHTPISRLRSASVWSQRTPWHVGRWNNVCYLANGCSLVINLNNCSNGKSFYAYRCDFHFIFCVFIWFDWVSWSLCRKSLRFVIQIWKL